MLGVPQRVGDLQSVDWRLPDRDRTGQLHCGATGCQVGRAMNLGGLLTGAALPLETLLKSCLIDHGTDMLALGHQLVAVAGFKV